MLCQDTHEVTHVNVSLRQDYKSRKSLPRDSAGFEPIDGYFVRRDEDNDGVSPMTFKIWSVRYSPLLQRASERALMTRRA